MIDWDRHWKNPWSARWIDEPMTDWEQLDGISFISCKYRHALRRAFGIVEMPRFERKL